MARRYRPVDRDQVFLLPPSMIDWPPEDHLVWFVIEAVRRLDTTRFPARARLGGVGRRGYDPDMLVTLLVYAMAHGVRSSRRIERLCHTDVAFRIICAADVPDHTVLARFRQHHEAALADLLTATLRLCAELGMVRLGVVALDGTKIAANASRDANRTEAGLRRLAEQHLAESAATDQSEDALFGVGVRGDEVPEKLRDRTHRGARIGQALQQIEQREAAARDRAEQRQAEADAYTRALALPDRPPRGGVPKAVDPVAAAPARLDRERARAQARSDAWHAKADAAAANGHRLPGTRPAPVDEHHLVRTARAAYDAARATAPATEQPTEHSGGTAENRGDATHPGDRTADRTGEQARHATAAPTANLTDPDSRVLKTRNGWVQGYNCQTATSEDQFFVHAQATQDANDIHQFAPTATAVSTAAEQLARHTGRDDLNMGTVLADAGYDSDDNLTAPGPDRLIANAKRHTITQRAATDPATADPPGEATARHQMDHRLRTADGQQLYQRRAPLVEAPNAWLKDGRGLRQFARRGLSAANSELRFACAVTNLLRLRARGITTTRLATG